MSETTFLDAVSSALDRAADYTNGAEAAPVAILWPDESGQWEPLVDRLRATRLVLTLGAYEPLTHVGPAYWIRCAVDGVLPEVAIAAVPIIYLPGVGRRDVRAVEEAPPSIKPLAELQYRGVIFAQASGRDWTLIAFLQAIAARGGLDIAVASDDATKAAVLGAREALAGRSLAELRRHAPLGASFFNGLLMPDVDRDMLLWLNDPIAFKAERTPDQLDAFAGLIASRFAADLSSGEIAIAQQLGLRQTDAWELVWQRYADSPERYPSIERHLRAARPAPGKQPPGLFDKRGSWPQENEEAEAALREALQAVGGMDAATARDRLLELEQIHEERRSWVWAELGRAPLAAAMEWLAKLASETRRNVPDSGVADITDAYANGGWHADDALMRATGAVKDAVDIALIGKAALAVYRDWLEVGAERFQHAVREDPAAYVVQPLDQWAEGTCVLFTDGLRMDVAHRLSDRLTSAGIDATVTARLTALPSMTPTAKPAASPASGSYGTGSGFTPNVAGTGKAFTAEGLRHEVGVLGYQELESDSLGEPAGRAWGEQGDIDTLGHKQQAKLPALLDGEVMALASRIQDLLNAGWKQVVVVTDHGWLYLPGGLPGAELAQHLAEDRLRKGRAARLAPGADVAIQTVPWFWDATVQIAVAPGIRSFVGTPVYEHGGLSPQECVTPVVIATRAAGGGGTMTVTYDWAGLRARVVVANAPDGCQVDLRRKAGDPSASVCGGPAPVGAGESVSLLVTDEDLIGTPAFLVAISSGGSLLAEHLVVVGGQA